ncbi:Ppx/GppA family phosphatase [Lactococcus protaetiae]|uniref:Ppx/GppA family phosphatase n=1 Tax=Lactococcus protaetiae TaxID=2592653 RepID=A0A514Z9W3_9LACT|nr:Ppx/GppA family phosphatase [Lactococcus protaetiae]QDK71368.1 Ppx/GppA family phosphatase [Lactococcus protaetiae]
MKRHKIALIDIGSNSVRLVIYDIQKEYTYKEIQDIKMPIRLYQYLDEYGNLSQIGIDELIKTLRIFEDIIKLYHPKKTITTATAVIRQARNSSDVLKELERRSNFKIRLLSEKEEAAYGQYAVSHLTTFEEAYTVDMGGGSTEVTYYRGNELIHSHSFPFGVVRLMEMFFQGKEPGDLEAMAACERYVRSQFKTQDWIHARNVPIVAMGGSSRNMASIHQRMVSYPITGLHGYSMTVENIKSTKFFLAAKSLKQLRDLDGLSRDRADIIIPATITFQALIETTSAERMYFVKEGLREGLLINMINAEVPETYPVSGIRRTSIARLLVNYGIDPANAKQRLKRVRLFQDLMIRAGLVIPSEQLNDYLYYASMLYLAGSYIEADDSSMHTFYLLANSNISGFKHRDRVIIALLASYKNKSLFNQYLTPFHDWFEDSEIELILKAGNLVRFCDALNVIPMNKIEKAELLKEGAKYRLRIKWSLPPYGELSRAERQKKKIEYILGKKVILDFYN